MKEKLTIKQFEVYLKGNLSAEDKAIFESTLKEDKDVQLEFERYKEVVLGIKAVNFRHQIGQVIEESDKAKEVLIGSSRKTSFYWVAATITLLLAAITFFSKQNKTIDELYAANFQAYPVLDLTREAKGDAFEKALELYDNASFDEAIQSFQQIDSSAEIYDIVLFYTAVSYMASDKFENAAATFKKLPPNIVFEEQKRWYLALCYLALDDVNQSKELLSEIVEGAYAFEKSQILLKRID